MWYVVQVKTGSEQRMAELIEGVATPGVLEECFAPRYETEAKVRGRWLPYVRVLFPGYVVAVTDDARALAQDLARIPEPAHLLSMGEKYVPLADEDVAWLAAFTERGARAVGMSRALVEGGVVRVVEGPLVGREALIERVDRKRSTAWLAFDVCGRRVSARVGLSVVAAPDEASARAARVRVAAESHDAAIGRAS